MKIRSNGFIVFVPKYVFHPFSVYFYLGSVWNPESIQGNKKKYQRNDFLMFDFIVENIKENQIKSKFL